MTLKKWVWLGMLVGSSVGGFVPMIWGDSALSVSGFILSFVGGIGGIWAGYECHKRL